MASLTAGKYARFELERRYILKAIPKEFAHDFEEVRISDKYFSDTRLRLRKLYNDKSTSYKLSNKYFKDDRPDGCAVITNFYLNKNEYNLLCGLGGSSLEKTRKMIKKDGLSYCLDEINEDGQTRWICEVNFSSMSEMEAFILPFDEVDYEITSDIRWTGGAMAFGMGHTDDFTEPLVTERLVLRPIFTCAPDLICGYLVKNREFHKPWSPDSSDEYFTEEYWSEKINKALNEFYTDRSLRFYFSKRGTTEIIGDVSFSRISRGPFQACNMGYSMAQSYTRQGYMVEGARRAIEYMFEEKKIHRIEANYVVGNEASARTLKKLGFVQEGTAKDYLHIDGEWKDHVLNSLTNVKILKPG